MTTELMNKITAEQARTLVQEKQSTSNPVIIYTLKQIYSKIEEYANQGKMNTELRLPSGAMEFKNIISSVLTDDGYKVKFKRTDSWRDFDEYIKISWDT